MRVQRVITNRHEGLGFAAGLGDPNGVDSKDPHLVEDALDHIGGLIGGLREDLEVQLHPVLRALLLPLQEVPWRPPQAERSGKSWGGLGSQVSWGSQRHIKRSHDSERSEAVTVELISGSQSSQRLPIMGPGIKKGHRS